MLEWSERKLHDGPEDQTTRVVFAASRSWLLEQTHVRKEPGGRLVTSQLLFWLYFLERKIESERKPGRRWRRIIRFLMSPGVSDWLLEGYWHKIVNETATTKRVFTLCLVKMTNNWHDTPESRFWFTAAKRSSSSSTLSASVCCRESRLPSGSDSSPALAN